VYLIDWQEIGFDDDSGGGYSDTLDFTAKENARYYIDISGIDYRFYTPSFAASGSGSAFNFGYELAVNVRGFNSLESPWSILPLIKIWIMLLEQTLLPAKGILTHLAHLKGAIFYLMVWTT
jgi:hypothetical protein